MTTDSCWHVLLLAIVLGWLVWAWQLLLASHHAGVTTQVERLLKPRTPVDCPACRKQRLDQTATALSRLPVTPWREHKSRRGAMGRIATQGFACPNHMCKYYRVTDAQVHALVGNGTHGKCESIVNLIYRQGLWLADSTHQRMSRGCLGGIERIRPPFARPLSCSRPRTVPDARHDTVVLPQDDDGGKSGHESDRVPPEIVAHDLVISIGA